MTTITRERLLKIQKWRETYGPGSNVVLPAEEAEELARIALASLTAEPVACPKCNDTGMADSGGVQPWGEPISVPCDCTAQPALAVDADDNFYSWFGREWHDHYQQNKYTTAAKQMLGVMAESAWKAGRRAAMLQGADGNAPAHFRSRPAQSSLSPAQGGNSPVIPDGWKLVPVELTGAMTNAMTDAILDDLHNVDVWRSVLAAAPQQEDLK